MRIRSFTTIALAGLGFAVLTLPAAAAISVLGNGISNNCYEAAEFGGTDVTDGIAACTAALTETALSQHDRAATLINRGILRSRDAQTSGALEDYNEGLRLDADLGEGYVDRGAAQLVLKDYDAALADINKGIALNANKLEIAYYDRGIVDEAQGNIKEAYMDYKKAVELQPNFQLANDQLMRFRVVHRHPDGA